MSDKKRLIELLESFGIEEKEKLEDFIPRDGYAIDDNHIILGEGSGYNYFYVIFTFDNKGKFINWGVWG